MDDDAIREAIRAHPAEAARALEMIQVGADQRVTADAIAAAAAMTGLEPDALWVLKLREAGLVLAFVNALRGQGVALDEQALADPDGAIPFDALTTFLPRAKAFRCRVLVNGAVKGSGCLVGPSLVLTSWHVIAVDAPGRPQEPAPDVSVFLADETLHPAIVPARFESTCGDSEFKGIAPRNDDEVNGRHDVALLAMRRPAAAHLGFVPLPALPPDARSRSRIVVVHFPQGQDLGVDFGLTRKVRNVTARWRHDVATKDGSSGGACFDRELRLVGVHQGKLDDGARFVPLDRFLADVSPFVESDLAPLGLWSLDGTVDGPLVVARDLLFEAIAAASAPVTRVRGLRVKRRRIEAGSAGLPFTHDILAALVSRKGAGHLIVRVTLDEIVPDLVAEIRRRVRVAGIPVPEPAEAAGVAPGQAPPETTAKDRAANLATAVEAAAAAKDSTVWFFFDNPSVPLAESARLEFEGFVDAALVQPHLRLVVAGFETLPLPGLEFAGPFAAGGEGLPGLVVEFLGGFSRSDLVNLLTRASQELTGQADPGRLGIAADRALLSIPDFNGIYADDQLATVTEGLRPDLVVLRHEGGGGG